jgi:hypothetical protein
MASGSPDGLADNQMKEVWAGLSQAPLLLGSRLCQRRWLWRFASSLRPRGGRQRFRFCAAAFLIGHRRQVLLAVLECSDFSVSRTLEIHSEPKHGNEQTGDSRRHILCRLQPLVGRELLYFLIVGGDLSQNRGAIHVAVRWLDNSNGCWCSPGTANHGGA